MASCKSIGSVVEKIWGNYGEILVDIPTGNPYVAAAQAALKATDKAIKGWNNIAKNSSAKIGPRMIQQNKRVTGTVVGPTDRTFVTPAPLQAKEATVIIKKLDHRGKAEVAVCTYDKNKKHKKLFEYTFDSGKGNIGKKVTYKIRNAKDKVVVFTVNGKCKLLDKFKYSIELKAEQDVDQKKDKAPSTNGRRRSGTSSGSSRRKVSRGRSGRSRSSSSSRGSSTIKSATRAVSGAARIAGSLTSKKKGSRKKSGTAGLVSQAGGLVGSLLKK